MKQKKEKLEPFAPEGDGFEKPVYQETQKRQFQQHHCYLRISPLITYNKHFEKTVQLVLTNTTLTQCVISPPLKMTALHRPLKRTLPLERMPPPTAKKLPRHTTTPNRKPGMQPTFCTPRRCSRLEPWSYLDLVPPGPEPSKLTLGIVLVFCSADMCR